jgi:hypothetical protein
MPISNTGIKSATMAATARNLNMVLSLWNLRLAIETRVRVAALIYKSEVEIVRRSAYGDGGFGRPY